MLVGKLEGVIFDMDGVLCDSEPFICEAAMAMFLERYGQTVEPEDFLPFVGAGEDRYLGGVAEKYGMKLNMPSDKEHTYTLYLERIVGRLPPMRGVENFIADCRQAGLKLAVATSADERKMQGNLLEIGQPPSVFDALVNGLEVERKKPHPDIFLKAADRLHLSPSTCLVVEDAHNGVQAAKAAGARCLGLTSSFSADVLRDAGADWIAADLEEARAILAHLI